MGGPLWQPGSEGRDDGIQNRRQAIASQLPPEPQLFRGPVAPNNPALHAERGLPFRIRWLSGWNQACQYEKYCQRADGERRATNFLRVFRHNCLTSFGVHVKSFKFAVAFPYVKRFTYVATRGAKSKKM